MEVGAEVTYKQYISCKVHLKVLLHEAGQSELMKLNLNTTRS